MARILRRQYQTLAIVPARGGSKSIPHKNIYPLGGKPLLSYTLGAIRKSRFVDRIIVSTDDKKIVAAAKRFGAEVPFMRPPELAKDSSPTIPVIAHALQWLEGNEGYSPDYVLLVQPTEPFVKHEQIDDLFKLVVSKKADSGITIIAVPRIFHPYHVRRITPEGYLVFDNPKMHYAHPNRQSDPKRYGFGNCYWFRRDKFLKGKKIEVGKRVGLEIDPVSAHDINSKADMALAEFFLKKKAARA